MYLILVAKKGFHFSGYFMILKWDAKVIWRGIVYIINSQHFCYACFYNKLDLKLLNFRCFTEELSPIPVYDFEP